MDMAHGRSGEQQRKRKRKVIIHHKLGIGYYYFDNTVTHQVLTNTFCTETDIFSVCGSFEGNRSKREISKSIDCD